jgi:hypothetical protein
MCSTLWLVLVCALEAVDVEQLAVYKCPVVLGAKVQQGAVHGF